MGGTQEQAPRNKSGMRGETGEIVAAGEGELIFAYPSRTQTRQTPTLVSPATRYPKVNVSRCRSPEADAGGDNNVALKGQKEAEGSWEAK